MIQHTKANRCPICAGAQTDPQGKGVRCWGFTSDDGKYVRCTRENFAGSLQADGSFFIHYVGAPCKCGGSHGETPHNGSNRTVLATYEYRDEESKTLYRVLRYLPKSFSQERWDEKQNAYVGGEGAMRGVRRVPYRLPELLASTGTVLVVEGEKDADTGYWLGFPSTCNVGGAGQWQVSHNAHLKGRDVIILPDQDEKGLEHAKSVEAHLKGHAKSIKIINLPEKDLSKWVETGGTKEALQDLITKPVDWRSAFGGEVIEAKDLYPLINEPIPYIVNPIIVRGSLTQIQGIPKGGKSAFGVYLALCAATSVWPFPQHIVADKCLKVVYIAWEDPKIMMAKRLALYAAGIGFDRWFLPEGVTFLFGPDIFIDQEKALDTMKAMVAELKPDIVFIDTLSHIHMCDENSSSEMKVPMKRLDKLAKDCNIGVVYLHHTAKGNGIDKATVDKGRGSGAIAAAWHVLIDWGVRDDDSNVNPVCVQSKYLNKWKFWNISYITSEPDELGEPTKVSWDIDTQEKLEKEDKLGSTENKRKRIIQTLQTLSMTSEWASAIDIANASNLGLDERTIRRHMSVLCQESKALSKVVNRALYYRIAKYPESGQMSGQA